VTRELDWRTRAGRMVSSLGTLDPRVAQAMREVPRHEFVPVALASAAYEDTPLPLPAGDATISAPHMVALQLEWAELAPGLRVLEVGSGCGYLAALVAQLTAPEGTVDGVELVPALPHEARRRVERLGFADRVRFIEGDGSDRVGERGPYDRIIVSCATRQLFPLWLRHLAPHGTVVAPVGDAWGQELVRYREDDPLGPLDRGPRCAFVPLRRALSPDI